MNTPRPPPRNLPVTKPLIALSSLLLAAALLCVAAVAGDAPAGAAKRRENKDRIEIPGTVVSIGATLESMGANAEDTLHAKGAQGLLAPDGTLWTFVDNAKGHGVVTNQKLRGKEVKILGWKFSKTQYVEVSKYAVKEGDAWVPYDYCKNCGWEADHDNKDTDLCEGCKEGGGEEGGK